MLVEFVTCSCEVMSASSIREMGTDVARVTICPNLPAMQTMPWSRPVECWSHWVSPPHRHAAIINKEKG